MSCSSCVSRIEKTLRTTPGVAEVTVNLATNSGAVSYNPSLASAPDLLRAVEKMGYRAEAMEDIEEGRAADKDDTVAVVMITAEPSAQADVSKSGFVEIIRSLNGVLEVIDAVGPSGVKRRRDWSLKVKFDETKVGPRAIVLLGEEHGLAVSVSSLGGFMRAEKMNDHLSREASALLRNLFICLTGTIPILVNYRSVLYIMRLTPRSQIIGMAIPLAGSMEANQRLQRPFDGIPGLNAYGLLLFLLCTPIEFIVGMRFHVKALEAMQTRTLGMDFLVSTGTGAAYAYSLISLVTGIVTANPRPEVEYFETAAVLISVVILGKYLEVASRGRTAAAIQDLASHRAQKARLVSPTFKRGKGSGSDAGHSERDASVANFVWRRRGGYLPLSSESNEPTFEDDEVIDVSLVQKEDILRLVAGETIPADGVVVSEKITVDESMLTGESAAIIKGVGDKVFGGTMVTEGAALLRVTDCGDKSALGKILTLVQEAQSSRPVIQEVADQVASYFVPLVAIISLITFISWIIAFETGRVAEAWLDKSSSSAAAFAFYFALSVWVSACPCAFGLATPTAVLVASGVAAKHGILIRKGVALQLCSEVRCTS